MASSDVEVVVVGAGAAGIAAARRLHDSGVSCLLVEARPRLGGRALTVIDEFWFCARPRLRLAAFRGPQSVVRDCQSAGGINRHVAAGVGAAVA